MIGFETTVFDFNICAASSVVPFPWRHSMERSFKAQHKTNYKPLSFSVNDGHLIGHSKAICKIRYTKEREKKTHAKQKKQKAAQQKSAINLFSSFKLQ